MKQLKDIRSVYLLGIGGIGMSALARYFREKGTLVWGYDRTATPLTRQLVSEGIFVHYADDLNHIIPYPDLVIYTPAIPANSQILTYYREGQFPVYKRSEVLGMITREMFSITVGGTHGKTTVSTMIAHILRESGYGCNAFLGGISVNYETNYWSSPKEVAVVEADEYDRSFLQLAPDIAVVTAMDADHLDIYGTIGAMEEAYVLYTQKIKSGGTLVIKYGLPRLGEMGGNIKITYSLQNEASGAHAKNIRLQHGGYAFSVIHPAWVIDDLTMSIGGIHNVENAIAAITVAQCLGIDREKIKTAVASFKGIKRRFEYILKTDRLVFIDDYAHHPEELKALIGSARSLFPDRRCTVIFQPHLYSRTRDLAAAFAEALDRADEVILLPLYPAREEPVAGVDSGMIAKKMNTRKETQLLTKTKTLVWLKEHEPELLITAGAGDIDKLVAEIREIFLPVSGH